MVEFDYGAPAELFPARNRKVRQTVRYRRFDRAAEAIRFAMEEMPPLQLLGATIEVGEERFGHENIRALYESEAYPLKRRAGAKTSAPQSATARRVIAP